jgi:hypothetical protein
LGVPAAAQPIDLDCETLEITLEKVMRENAPPLTPVRDGPLALVARRTHEQVLGRSPTHKWPQPVEIRASYLKRDPRGG